MDGSYADATESSLADGRSTTSEYLFAMAPQGSQLAGGDAFPSGKPPAHWVQAWPEHALPAALRKPRNQDELTAEEAETTCTMPAYLPAVQAPLSALPDESEADIRALRELVVECTRAVVEETRQVTAERDIHDMRLKMRIADQNGLGKRGQALLNRRREIRQQLDEVIADLSEIAPDDPDLIKLKAMRDMS
mmetsp:Transcript_146473/g.280858  ORF Transcript_146473/g.280858 Transcript_146473/m.280858 type:complete len:192 (+) Transcript_146473:55-630(+)